MGNDDIEKACAGDRDAWRRIAAELVPDLEWRARRLGRPAHAVDDAVQETLLRLYLHLDDFDPALGTLRTWSRRILTNVVIGEHRREHTKGRDAAEAGFATVNASEAHDEDGYDLPADPRAADPAVQVEERDVSLQALASLDPKSRRVFVMRAIEGRGYDEIAAELDDKPAALRKRVERARSTMRAALGQDDDGDRERRPGV